MAKKVLDCPPPGRAPDPLGCDNAQPFRVCNVTELATALAGSSTPEKPITAVVVEGTATGLSVPMRITTVNNPDGTASSVVNEWYVSGAWTTTQPAGWVPGEPPPVISVDSENILIDGCAAGVYTPSRFITQFDNAGVATATTQQWLVAGAWTATSPAGWSQGACPTTAKQIKVYLANITATTTLASVVATLGSPVVTSISVMQHVGNNGAINGDTGTGIHLQLDASWSVSTDNNIDSLSASALAFVPGAGGEQHLTIVYVG